MQILRRKLTKEEFKDYVNGKNFGSITPNKIVLHHTWRPTVETWAGERTIDGLKRYYEGLGWSAGPHIFVAEDGIWLFTDMSQVGIHAGNGNATWVQNGVEKQGFYYTNATLKSYSIGVEVVGDYDEKVWENETRLNALACLSCLQKRLNIPNPEIHFHREYSPKSCPGNAITREWLENQLAAYNQGQPTQNGYQFKFSEAEARRAQELGFLKQIDTETREIIAIGLTRVYERVKKEFQEKT